MAQDQKAGADRLTSGKPPAAPLRYAGTILAGLVLGTAAYFGWRLWSDHQVQQVVAANGDADLAHPAAQECAIARAAIAAFHASGEDKRQLASAGEKAMTVTARSKVVNPIDVPGYADDEAQDLRGKSPPDWRWCAGLGAFVHGLGWSPMGADEDIPELGLGRPAINAAGDEAKVYEVFVAPDANGGPRLKAGPWLATLRKGPGGAWAVTATTALPRR